MSSGQWGWPALVFAAGLLGCGERAEPTKPVKPVAKAPTRTPAPTPPPTAPGPSGPPPITHPVLDFARVFEQVAPSVVGVVAGDVRAEGFEAARQGSGFVWDARGHVVTNDHIVEGATAFQIRTRGNQVASAVVVGRDARTDLAVLRVEGDPLPALPRGAPSALKPGQWVAAVGSPYGFDHSITVGVVSALGRREPIKGGPRYANFIQTDASINPGNSGGPLVNARGQAVGVNTAVLGRGQGVSFATPIDMVETVVARLLTHGRFVRGFAGLYVGAVPLSAATEAGLLSQRGAFVTGVVMNGPAHRAGVEPGDIILAYDGAPVEDHRMLSWMFAATSPGRSSPVRLIRGDQRLNLMMKVEEAPD